MISVSITYFGSLMMKVFAKLAANLEEITPFAW